MELVAWSAPMTPESNLHAALAIRVDFVSLVAPEFCIRLYSPMILTSTFFERRPSNSP
jgi:hypothetical protein